jgi:DNA modification methylase
MFSFAGDTVLDPFGGTGTTALAAVELGRNSITIEIEPQYIDLIDKRFANLGSVLVDVDVRKKLKPKRAISQSR